jgi:hypothetical protein
VPYHGHWLVSQEGMQLLPLFGVPLLPVMARFVLVLMRISTNSIQIVRISITQLSSQCVAAEERHVPVTAGAHAAMPLHGP